MTASIARKLAPDAQKDSPLAQRSVTILGSTGSIGRNAVNLVEGASGRFSVTALTAMDNVDLLAAQARKLRPALAVIGNEERHDDLKSALEGTGIRTAAGAQALIEAASLPSEMVISAIVGAAGLRPTLAAAKRGAMIALANKECLVCAGPLMLAAMRESGARLLPVDSEHSAIFQVFDFDHPEYIEKITITASGGPFRTFTREAMREVTPDQAIRHPNWAMGAKISVDSATLMNKGLELIEAFYLFPVRREQLDVVIHPESIVHSLVSYVDGSVLAQLGAPDMRTPIAHAMAWPKRMETPVRRLDLTEIGRLTFEKPDTDRFPALSLAREALARGGCAPAVLSAANEVAVARFLSGEIGFLDIVRVIEHTLPRVAHGVPSSIESLLERDREARAIAAAFAPRAS